MSKPPSTPRLVLALCVLCLLAIIAPIPSARADGGVILDRKVVGPYDITVFASPAPIRAGPVDFSVLVQDPATRAPYFDAEVAMAWSAEADAFPAWLPPCCSMGTADKAEATRNHSENKMLYSAIMPVKSQGASKLLVRVTRNGETYTMTCHLNAGPPQPPVLAYWPVLAFPPLLILGFGIHQRLVRKGRISAKE